MRNGVPILRGCSGNMASAAERLRNWVAAPEKMTRLLAAAGYDMIGVDNSEEMLEIAREAEYEADAWSAAEAWDEAAETDEPEEYAELGEPDEPDELPNGGILYLLEDMRELELYGSVCAVVSVCDSMNYILEEADLREVFSRVHEYLEEDGVFIFDLNTVYKYRDLLGETTIAENREEGSFIWENYFDEGTGINEYALNFFVRQENGLYERIEEFHYQKAYETEQVKALMEASGMRLLGVYGEGTKEEPGPDCERVYFVACEQGKTETEQRGETSGNV